MDLGQAKIATAIAVNVFAEYFLELYDQEIFPREVEQSRDTKTIRLQFEPPVFLAFEPESGDPYTRLELSGHMTVWDSDDSAAPPTTDEDFAVALRLGLVLVERSGQAPVVGIEYQGIDGTVDNLLLLLLLNVAFNSYELKEKLAAVEMDMLTPMIAALEPIYFSEPTFPSPDSWDASIRVLLGDGADREDSIAIFLGLPGENSDPGQMASPLPSLMGLAVVYSRNLLDFVLAASASEKKGTEVGEDDEKVKVVDLEMSMLDDAIYIDGKAEKKKATINFSGPIRPTLVRGTTALVMDVDDVSVDVNMPWYYYFAIGLAVILFFIPGLNLFDLALIPKLADAADEADEAPDTLRGGLATALAVGMAALATGLALQLEEGEVSIDSTTDHLDIVDGNMLFFAQVFVSILVSPIRKADYSKLLRRFVQYGLADGRFFRYSELARLVAKGKIICPGYHDVKGEYMRSNPDQTSTNNLLEVFGR
jgi:hypothetical protein